MSLAAVLDMPAPEFSLWREYHQRYGFPIDRVVWAAAKAGSAICRAQGMRIKPEVLIPVFVVQRGMQLEALAAGLAALPGAKVARVSADQMRKLRAASRTI